jgi:ABC-type transport system involved in cytochrome c biogenesis permease subunit
MFTTGNHLFLYMAIGLFAVSFLLYLLKTRAAGFIVLISGFVMYSLYLAGRGWLAGVFIPNPVVEGPYLLPWCLAVISIFAVARGDEQSGLMLVPLLAFSAGALFYVRGIIPPTPNKLTPWATAFFVTEVFAHALFYAGAFRGAVFLAQKERADAFQGYLVWGFVFYSVAQVTGAIWCYLGWGNTFQWGPRHMSSACIWLIYAAYLHLRFIPGWNGGRRAWYSIAASAALLALSWSSYLHEMTFPRIGG